jgi:hypothetical protein
MRHRLPVPGDGECRPTALSYVLWAFRGAPLAKRDSDILVEMLRMDRPVLACPPLPGPGEPEEANECNVKTRRTCCRQPITSPSKKSRVSLKIHSSPNRHLPLP